MLVQPFLSFRQTLTICAFALFFTQQASATVFDINRVIGAGSVTGFLETDGTLGVLGAGNITDYELTLSHPNLSGGSPDVINFANTTQFSVSGTALSATLTSLTFDFLDTGLLLIQGGNKAFNSNFWCLDGFGQNCNGTGDSTENIGFTATPTFVSFANVGSVTIGTTQPTVVPIPATLSLIALGLFAAGYSRRKAV